MSRPENPLDRKNLILGKKVFSGHDESIVGREWTNFVIWVFERPWLLKKARTESGLLGVLKWRYLEVERVDFVHLQIQFQRH